MKEACEEAYAREFVENNPEKYNYLVGIKGSKLSGGQKQRIAIARAIIGKPKILILDKATSALDNKSEKEVQRALEHISQKNVTTVIIAHRLSTIKNADVIFAIKEGKVLEKGTHKELLEKNGYYAGLVKSQLAQDELESKEENYVLSKKKSSLQHMSKMLSKKKSSHLSQEALGAVLEPEVQLKKLERKPMKVDSGRVFALLSDCKCEIFFAILGALIAGGLTPGTGFITAKSINTLCNNDFDIVNDDGLFYAMMFLVIAIGNGLANWLKIWKFQTIGSILTTKTRKLVIDKYLKLHMGFFDVDENAPGALLTHWIQLN